MNKSIPLILLYFIFINLLNAQVNFNSIPQDKQLIARDISSNTGLFTVDGVVSTESSTALNYDGSATLSGDLTINSDMRLKSNIISLSGALAKLLEIDGKTYTMKSNEKDAKIGLLAQDVQKVLPELVKESDDKQGTLSVNYQGLIPVLINAIKEQQEQIDELKQLLNK